MNAQQLNHLLDRYLTGELSPEERIALAETIGRPEHRDALERLTREVLTADDLSAGLDDPAAKSAIIAHLDAAMAAQRRRLRIPHYVRYAAAAVVLLAVAGLVYFAGSAKNERSIARQPAVTHDVAPGHEGAVLTLADGKQIVLDSSGDGSLARQGGMAITKEHAGRLVYAIEPTATFPQTTMYNTLTTPRGRRTSVVLSDGTKVWLNAASSIKFPAAFMGKDRTVELSGEAYFEVAKDAGKPFRVHLNRPGKNPEIEVLGTSFDVMAYEDEETVSTTLVDGSVRVTTGAGASLLRPGQQLLAASDGKTSLVADADVQKITAWKEGNFIFHGDELSDIMKQLARWYDIDVHYDSPVTDHYTGKISRQVNISQVLKMLQAAGGVNFTVENRQVRVSPKI
ncbi:FecR domain-containing protein [Puia sp. P3]|uniref:FecR domain-containing protein n=1 Tax=Puia sp. P3 TaxID=3423952 RepID=UPI003D664AF5